nr:immunoglobulin light chain junction region [Macaca mulatta]MOW43818.1 immunoglobulin light chain junction region [Macaca mulatta]MOW44639.1 immunoglobulin light chain junction region [Macaca mulatta]
CQQYDIDPYNF